MGKDLRELEKKTGYQFHDFRLLERAMTHKSYINEAQMERYECNERLEFLGDAVLELVTSEYLFRDKANYPEGELTRMRGIFLLYTIRIFLDTCMNKFFKQIIFI